MALNGQTLVGLKKRGDSCRKKHRYGYIARVLWVQVPPSALFIEKRHGVCPMTIHNVAESHRNMDTTKELNTTNNLKLEKRKGYDGDIAINLMFKPCPRHHTFPHN
jgi:hypothetical protein